MLDAYRYFHRRFDRCIRLQFFNKYDVIIDYDSADEHNIVIDIHYKYEHVHKYAYDFDDFNQYFYDSDQHNYCNGWTNRRYEFCRGLRWWQWMAYEQ